MSERVTWGDEAYAGFWRRFAGLLVDGLILSAATGFLAGALGPQVLVEPIDPATLQMPPGMVTLLTGWSVIGIVIFVAYETAMLTTLGWTLGKKVVGVEVRGADGALLSVPRAIGRSLGKYVSALPLYLGFLWAAWDGRKQAWHDKFVSSYVLKSAALQPTGDLAQRPASPEQGAWAAQSSWGIPSEQPLDRGTAVPGAPPDAAPGTAREPQGWEAQEREAPPAPEPVARPDGPWTPPDEPARPEPDAGAERPWTPPDEPARPEPDAGAERPWTPPGEWSRAEPAPEAQPPGDEAEEPSARAGGEADAPQPSVVEEFDFGAPTQPEPGAAPAGGERTPEDWPAAPPTPPGPGEPSPGDPNLVAIAQAGIPTESASWLQQVAAQVDPRLDRVASRWRARPQAAAARACAFGLLLGYLARLYPHMQADLSRVAEAHPSFSALVAGSRLQTLQDIAGDPPRATAWLGPLVGAQAVDEVRRLFE